MNSSRMSRAIQISDDEDDAREDRLVIIAPSATRKRKQSPEEIEVVEQVVWTDDSDAPPELASIRKQRKLEKGKDVAKRKPREKGKAKSSTARSGNAKSSGTAKSRRSLTDLPDRIKGLAESEEQNVAEIRIPESLQRRRREFNETKRELQEAGLRLPPDFSDMPMPEDSRMKDLEERPQFPPNGFIKPCRPYKDVELEASAGIIPASIAQYLRDYQIVGVRFLHQLFVYQKGGILGDDMGLGKTVQVAAFLTAAFGKTGDERDAKRMRMIRRLPADEERWYPRVLIVCPGTLIENWKQELLRWGWWTIDTYHGANKADTLASAASGYLEVMITTYDTYKTHKDKINTVQWDCCVADECHSMKDRSSATTRAMTELNALCRIGLTGTAIQNNYMELWTLLDWSNPGMVGTAAEWSECIVRPLTIGQSHDATLNQLSAARTTAKKLVHNLLPQFFLRRMKSLIKDQLPKKSDKVVFCPLTDTQMDAYRNYLDGPEVSQLRELSHFCPCGSGHKKGWCCAKLLPSGKHWNTIVFPALINLMKIARHISLILPDSSSTPEKQEVALHLLQTCLPNKWQRLAKQRDSMVVMGDPELCGKWKVLNKMLKYWHDNGDKVLIFSHSVRLLVILNHLFLNTSYNTSYLDGSLKYEERQKVVDDFNSDPNQFVFLISTKAGGTGLNITSANKVVIFDPHWNPSWDLQAQDRAYRIGQARDVDVFRLISAGTIEEIVYARQIYKQQQANIGYSASTERRYFRGVQQDKSRQGELFGLENLFTFHEDSVILQDIVNKTNIAEAKAGVSLMSVDMDEVIADAPGAGPGDADFVKKEENDETGGLSQIAANLLKQEEDEKKPLDGIDPSSSHPKVDAIQAILASAGVEYTHENSEVIGSSKVEASLSRRAEAAAAIKPDPTEGDAAPAPDSAPLFAPDTQHDDDYDDDEAFLSLEEAIPDSRRAFNTASNGGGAKARSLRYKPPIDVQKRQFCSMAREFGFGSATDFALVVESWTQEQRRTCLEKFYARREGMLAAKVEKEDGERMKMEGVKVEGVKEEVDVKIKKEKEDVDVKIKKDEKDEDDDVVVMSDIPFAPKKEESPVEQKQPVVSPDDEETEDEDPMEIADVVVKPEVKVEEGRKPPVATAIRSTIFIHDDDDETDEL